MSNSFLILRMGRGRPTGSKRKTGDATTASATRPKRRISARQADRDDGVITEVVDRKTIKGIEHYQVAWADDSRKKSWEPAKKVEKVAKSLVDEFLKEDSSGEEEEFVVEMILDKKTTGKTSKYLVKWGGHDDASNSWEPADGLPRAMVKSFEGRVNSGASSVVVGRAITKGCVEYKIKKIGQGSTKTVPLYKLDESDLAPVQTYEKSQIGKKVEADDDVVTGEDEKFVVEKVIMRKNQGKFRRYRIKWQGFSNQYNTWEPIENLGGAGKIIRDYNKLQDEREEKMAEKDFEVEKIIDEKLHYSKPCFLVKWKGFSQQSNSWEPATQLENCKELLAQWEVTKQKQLDKQAAQMDRREKKLAEKKAEREKQKLAKAAEKAAEKVVAAAASSSEE